MKVLGISIRWALFFYLSSLAFYASAQDSLLLTKNFKFTDGIYFSFAAFKANQPDYALSELRAEIYTNPQNFMTHIQEIMIQTTDESVDTLKIDSLWGITIAGIPYIRLPKEKVDQKTWIFAGLQLRGKICYFSFENEYEREVIMPVYNPWTGRAFRSGVVKRTQKIKHEKMLHFETGDIRDFTIEAFKKWIQDDPKLLASVNKLSKEEIPEKLFKCMLIYVDRNQVYIEN